MYRYIFIIVTNLIFISPVALLSKEANTTITLEQAIQRVLESNPRIGIIKEMNEAAKGKIQQAAYLPNPTVGAEFENAYGSGPFKSTNALESTVSLKQLIELGGKRKHRTQVATKQKELLDWDSSILLQNLHNRTKVAFINVMLGQERVKLNQDLLLTVKDSYAEISKRHKASSSPKVDLLRAKLEMEQHEFFLQRSERKLKQGKIELASLWGGADKINFRVKGSIEPKNTLPDRQALFSKLMLSPQYLRYQSEIEVSRSKYDMEKANAVQDVSLMAGYRQFEASNDHALVIGFEIPIPFFNRNQGNIRAARANVRVSELEQKNARRELIASLSIRYESLTIAHGEAQILKGQLVPAATEALEETKKGYSKSLFPYMNVLEARKALLEIQSEYLDSVTRYHLSLADIERLTQPATLDN